MVKNEKNKQDYDRIQGKIRTALKLGYITKAKLDSYSSMKYLFRDISMNNKKSNLKHLGWTNPEDIPFNPEGTAYRATTSGSLYNLPLIKEGRTKIEYDFNEAYTNIMRNYPLPSNTFLKYVKYDTSKAIKRLLSYPEKRPYANLDTFTFFKVMIVGEAKPNTFCSVDSQGMLSIYGNRLNDEEIFSEIELRILIDFYNITEFTVLESYTFRCRKGMLDDYFERIEPLKHDRETMKLYKLLRTKVYGAIGQSKYRKGEENLFNQPVYNRAFSSMVAGVFRDRMLRYEQKYVSSEYGLIEIKTDGLYFMKEVPEFEVLVEKGVVKKKIHEITYEEEELALRRIEIGMI